MKASRNKKIMLLSILLCVCFLFAGCNEVNFVTYHNKDGSISEYIHLNINEQDLLDYAYNPSVVKDNISIKSKQIINNIIDKYNIELLKLYKTSAISIDEYNYYKDGLSLIQGKWQNDAFIIGLNFQDSNIYRQYYSALTGHEIKPNSPTQTKKLFYTKNYYYGTVGYNDYNIYTQLYEYYSAYFNRIPQENNSLYYSYSVDSKRYHSNADIISQDSSGNYVHTWKVDPTDTQKPIYFCTNTVTKENRTIWLIFSITISLLVTLLLCIIAIAQHLYRRNKKHIQPPLDTDENSNTIINQQNSTQGWNVNKY